MKLKYLQVREEMFEIKKSELKEIIKSILFVSGEGVELKDIADKLGFEVADIKKEVQGLKNELCGTSGIHIISYGNKIQLSSNPNYADYIASVLNPIREKALTKAAMQTLTIIAYKQPVTRLDIENIRGVSSDYAVQVLLEHNMIEVVGRKDVIGKPLLFGTTEDFLKRFDLESVEDLPDYEELLEKIKLIRVSEQEKSDSLYRDFTLPDEEVPEFLQGEEFQAINTDINLQDATQNEQSFEQDKQEEHINGEYETEEFEEDSIIKQAISLENQIDDLLDENDNVFYEEK